MKTCALFVDKNGEISVGYDKESAIRCKDQEQAKDLIWEYGDQHNKPIVKPGYTLLIPGWTFKVEEKHAEDSGVDGSGPPYSKVDFESVAILIKESEKVETVKEDSEEEFWYELHVKAIEGLHVGAMLTYIRDNFRITRKNDISEQENHEAIGKILPDNITFEPQVDGYVIHGAIEKIIEYFTRKMDQ